MPQPSWNGSQLALSLSASCRSVSSTGLAWSNSLGAMCISLRKIEVAIPRGGVQCLLLL